MVLEGNGRTIAASSYVIFKSWIHSTKKCAIRWRNRHNELAQFSHSPVGGRRCYYGSHLVVVAPPGSTAASPTSTFCWAADGGFTSTYGAKRRGDNIDRSTKSRSPVLAFRSEMERSSREGFSGSCVGMANADQLLWPSSGRE